MKKLKSKKFLAEYLSLHLKKNEDHHASVGLLYQCWAAIWTRLDESRMKDKQSTFMLII